MNETLLVNIVQGTRDRCHESSRFEMRVSLRTRQCSEIVPLHELRHDVIGTLEGLVDVIDGNDVRVFQLRQNASFGEISFRLLRFSTWTLL